jgi:hypothetical protein
VRVKARLSPPDPKVIRSVFLKRDNSDHSALFSYFLFLFGFYRIKLIIVVAASLKGQFSLKDPE